MTAPRSAVEAILRRRETLHFDPDRPVPDDLLVQLLDLARQAPSSFNLQPWRFLVVRDTSRRETLRRCAFGSSRIGEAPVSIVLLGYHYPHRTHLEAILDTMKARASLSPEAIAEFRGRALRGMASQADPAGWADRGCMLAAATLMIAAEGLGLNSCLIEPYDPVQIRDAFGVPADHGVAGLIALGHEMGATPHAGRLRLGDLCFEEHFGQPWTLGEPD